MATGVAQSAGATVTDAGEAVSDDGIEDAIAIVTAEAGREASASVYEIAEVAASEIVEALSAPSTTPGASASLTVTSTAAPALAARDEHDASMHTPSESKRVSLDDGTSERRPTTRAFSSKTWSLVPATVTCCGVAQFDAVNVSDAGLTVASCARQSWLAPQSAETLHAKRRASEADGSASAELAEVE